MASLAKRHPLFVKLFLAEIILVIINFMVLNVLGRTSNFWTIFGVPIIEGYSALGALTALPQKSDTWHHIYWEFACLGMPLIIAIVFVLTKDVVRSLSFRLVGVAVVILWILSTVATRIEFLIQSLKSPYEPGTEYAFLTTPALAAVTVTWHLAVNWRKIWPEAKVLRADSASANN